MLRPLLCIFFTLSLGLFLQAQPQDRPAMATSLNQQVDLINQYTKSIYKNARNYHQYNQRLNDKVRSGADVIKAPRFYFNPAQLPVSKYEEIQESTHLDHQWLFDSLWNLQIRQNTIGNQLAELTHDQPELNDSLTQKIYRHLQSIANYHERYRAFALQWDSLISQIANPPRMNEWNKSAIGLKSAIDTARIYLLKIRNGIHIDGAKMDTSAFSSQLTELRVDRQSNLGNIKELGSNNGNCALSRYDGVLFHLDRMIKECKTGRDLPLNDPKKYEYLVNHFNQAVDDYNAFARISARSDMGVAPAYLIKTVKEPGHYQWSKAEAPVIHPSLRSVSMDEFAPNHTVLLLDVSGSMNEPNKLPLMKEALGQLSPIMRSTDRISVVIYSDNARTILQNISFTDRSTLQKLDTLQSSGKTRAQQGLTLAYQVAHQFYIEDGNNRIIIASDGDFEMSREGMKLIKSEAKSDIELSVFAFGSRIKNQDQLKEMAAKGQGIFYEIHRQNCLQFLLQELQSVALSQ
jgi:Ca-activated chloride channel family protein